MKWLLKKVIPKKLLQFYRDKIENKHRTRQTSTEIYNTNQWNSKESVSGPGSDLSQTKTLIKELQNLLGDLNIMSILDIPCGDLNWMNKVNMTGIDYTGADVVVKLIKQNKARFSKRSNMRFKIIDLILDPLPKAELIFCRDCLVHFSHSDILKALSNIKSSECKYLLTTSFLNRTINEDIETGSWRPLNLQMPPFNFPEPLVVINEDCKENGGIYNDKSMCLWKISQLEVPLSVNANKQAQ